MIKHLLALILVLPLTLTGAGSEQAALAGLVNFTRTSKVAQADQDNPQAENFRITDVTRPFTFQKVGKIRKITRITMTVTLFDADTGSGEADQNELTLALDGIDTELKLNGFTNQADFSQTISGVPMNEAAIRAALKADRKLTATIRDADPADDNGVTGRSQFDATLVIKGKRRS